MTDPSHPEAGDHGGTAHEREPATSIPRWIKVAGVVVAVLVLLAIVLLFIAGGGDGGGHGPSRHG